MTTKKNLRSPSSRSYQLLLQAARYAEDWPVTGTAVRRFYDAESWALTELKQRLDTLEESGPSAWPQTPDATLETPKAMLAQLLEQSHSVDTDAARLRLYRYTLSRLLPDQVAMLALLADCGIAPLCNVAAGRLPAGPASVTVLANATSLGRDAGVLLRAHVPLYVTAMLDLGVMETGPEEERLAEQYELLLADTQVRQSMERVRGELKLYPRLQRYSVRLSAYGAALWRDCGPDAPSAYDDARQSSGSAGRSG